MFIKQSKKVEGREQDEDSVNTLDLSSVGNDFSECKEGPIDKFCWVNSLCICEKLKHCCQLGSCDCSFSLYMHYYRV